MITANIIATTPTTTTVEAAVQSPSTDRTYRFTAGADGRIVKITSRDKESGLWGNVTVEAANRLPGSVLDAVFAALDGVFS